MQSYTILCIIPNVCAFFSLFRKKCIRKFVQEEIKHYLCSRLKDECLWVILIFVGAIAQLVEQRTENPCVPGSIPGGTTIHEENAERLIADRPAFFHFLPFASCSVWYGEGAVPQRTRISQKYSFRKCEWYGEGAVPPTKKLTVETDCTYYTLANVYV